MSDSVQKLIWKVAPHKGNTLLLLLALGDWSDDEGQGWAILKALAVKSRQSERNARYALSRLKAGSWVEWDENLGGRGNSKICFKITLQKLQSLESKTCKRVQNGASKKGAKLNTPLYKALEHQESVILPPSPLCEGGQIPASVEPLPERDLRRLAKELDRVSRAAEGRHIEFSELLQSACINLLLDPLRAYCTLKRQEQAGSEMLRLAKAASA